MIVGSLSGPLCASGGFCAGFKDVVEHQRITALSSPLPSLHALPAADGRHLQAARPLNILQSNPEILTRCRESIKLMRRSWTLAGMGSGAQAPWRTPS